MHSKGNHKQNGKTTQNTGENICKCSEWQGIISKIYTCSSVKKANKKPTIQSKKWAEDLNGHPPKKTHRPPKSTWKDTCITNYQRIAHQNYSGLSPQNNQNGHHQNGCKWWMLERSGEKGNPPFSWYNQYGEQYGGSLKN